MLDEAYNQGFSCRDGMCGMQFLTSFHESKALTSTQSTNGKLIVLKRLLQHTFLLHLIFGEFKAISEGLRLPIIFAF